MDCTKVKELLSAYYDDELSTELRTAVGEHLADCDDCAGELKVFGSIKELEDFFQIPSFLGLTQGSQTAERDSGVKRQNDDGTGEPASEETPDHASPPCHDSARRPSVDR